VRRALPIVVVAIALLLLHRARFAFSCDDAYIALRYARNLAEHGAPVFNLGERVEGYTSPLFVFVIGLVGALGADVEEAAHVAGALSGALVVAATAWLLWAARVRSRLTFAGVLIAVAATAPIAAWSSGGLETALFAALTTACAACALERDGAPRLAGVLLGLTALARPEGLVVALIVIGLRARRRDTVLIAAAIVLGHLVFRRVYYGRYLPWTFAVKGEGVTAARIGLGIRYLGFAVRDGLPVVAPLFVVSAIALARREIGRLAILMVGLFVGFVVYAGGDFLDLYRFLVPALPIAIATVGLAMESLDARGLAAVALTAHAYSQWTLGTRALRVTDDERAAHLIEPLGWTRLYVPRWLAIGRFLAYYARENDVVATTAVGAIPFASELRTIDLYGLVDPASFAVSWPVGPRPGHARAAPEGYVASRRPTFVILAPDVISTTPIMAKTDAGWRMRGYVAIDARIDAARFEAPETFYVTILVPRDRAGTIAGAPR